MKHLKELVKWNWDVSCVCTISLSFEFISSTSHGKLFLVLFQANIYIKLLEINCKMEIVRVSIVFRPYMSYKLPNIDNVTVMAWSCSKHWKLV